MQVNIEVKYIRTWREKIIGLIGAKKPYPLVFKTRFGIHTFGLKFPIEVLILDHKLKVRCTKEKLLPNSFYFWNPKFNMVMELPLGTINKSNIKVGGVIHINYV